MCAICRGSTIDGDLTHGFGEVDVLHWKARLMGFAAILALLVVALGGPAVADSFNLYW